MLTLLLEYACACLLAYDRQQQHQTANLLFSIPYRVTLGALCCPVLRSSSRAALSSPWLPQGLPVEVAAL